MKKLFLLALLLLASSALSSAQFIGFVSQQSVTSTPFNAVTCAAALATGLGVVPNIGQSSHFVTVFPGTPALISLVYTIQGSFDGVNYFDISDPATSTGVLNNQGPTGITGSGYYPVVGVRVSTCTPSTAVLTLRYSGISMTPGPALGVDQQGQLTKNLAVQAPAGSSFSSPIMRTPFGSLAGTLQFVYSGPSLAGSTLSVACGTQNNSLLTVFGPVTIGNNTNVQMFPLPVISCPWFNVSYITGGASVAFFNLDAAFGSVANSGDPCVNYPKLSLPVVAAAATTTLIVPSVSNLSVYPCGYQLSQAVAGTIKWEYGTGALCAGGTVALSGAMQTLAGAPYQYGGFTIFSAPPGNGICMVTTGGGATVGGFVDFVYAP